MKTKPIWFLALIMLVTACKKQEPLSTVLSGELPDFKNTTVVLERVDRYFPGLASLNTQWVVQADSTGRFSFSVDSFADGFYQVTASNYPRLRYDLFLEAGDSIHVADSWNGGKPSFAISGRGADKLTYLINDFQVFPGDQEFYDKINSDAFTTPRAFKLFIDSIQQVRLDQLRGNKAVAERLKRHFVQVIQAEGASLMLEHLENRNRGEQEDLDYFYPDSAYYAFDDSSVYDPVFYQSTAGKKLAADILNAKARQAFQDKDEEAWWKESLSWKLQFVHHQPKGLWKDLLALGTVSDYSMAMFNDDFFDHLKAFRDNMSHSFTGQENDQLFQANLAPYFALAPGMPAPDFELPDSTGNKIRLSDFKGKVVYLDFWGTWCYPCIEEIPKAMELQRAYADQPVVFLYVALEYDDENIAAWKNFIAGRDKQFGKFLANEPFPGVHLVAEKQFHNEQLKPYKLNFAPTHVLIDQEGKLVNIRADRPDRIASQLDELLGK